jgi:RNA polymerase sigma-70 factor (ECF subfamily)
MASRTSSGSASEDVFDALDRLIRAERGDLAGLARREGLGAEDAVDCVQDAFCTFMQISLRNELPALTVDYPPFLATLVRNAARNKRRRHHVARPHAEVGTIDPPADNIATDVLLARAEEHVRLRACVDRLCDTQKAVVTLRLLQERHGDDVAVSLGITRSHVDVLLHRAKQMLRTCLLEP